MAARSPSPALDLLFLRMSTLQVRGRVRVPIYTRQNIDKDIRIIIHTYATMRIMIVETPIPIRGFREFWQKSRRRRVQVSVHGTRASKAVSSFKGLYIEIF